MSHTRQSPAVIIARRHQSAPKEHWADREIKKAAEEIDAGNYVAPARESDRAALDRLGLALGMGGGGVAVGEKPALEEFYQTRDFNELGQHPRVLEALERMKREHEAEEDPLAKLELSWKLHELTAQQVAKDKWDGQQRWQGAENEEMRYGQILSPEQFFDKLQAVIGRDRGLMLSGNVVRLSPGDKSGRVAIVTANPEWEGEGPVVYPQSQAKQLKREGMELYTQGKQYRAAGYHALADKKMHQAAEKFQAATEKLMAANVYKENVPQFLRVASLQWPASTEWMIMHFDEYGVPTSPKFLGWRTALLMLIRNGSITEAEAHKAFPVGSGEAASWYRQQLKIFRDALQVVA